MMAKREFQVSSFKHQVLRHESQVENVGAQAAAPSPCPLPEGEEFSVPAPGNSVLGTRYSVLGTRYSVLDPRSSPRGITLVEVLISMFVALIGLLSLAALLSLGQFEMLEAAKADRSMSVARAALHDIKVRGFLRPTQVNAAGSPTPMWMNASGVPYTFTAAAPNLAYALDPLSIAVNGATAQNFPSTYLATGAFSNPTGLNPMVRITVLGSPSTGMLTAGAADTIFRSADDLIVSPPTGDYPPGQLYTSSTARRQSEGNYSWLATIEPARTGDQYMARVSIVVFFKRNVLLSAAPTASQAPPERMVNAVAGAIISTSGTPTATPGGAGLGGGELILSYPTSSGITTTDYLKVKPNQWILLSQAPSTPIMGSQIPAWFRWYKVVATSDPVLGVDSLSNPAYLRPVTLAGPDWNPFKTDPGNMNASIPTYASLFDGAIAVYERTMEIEESGNPWSPN